MPVVEPARRGTTEMAKKVRVFRCAPDGSEIGTLGFAYQHAAPGGWQFYPLVSGRKPSRKHHPTFEACMPRWTGYPDGCISEVVSD